MISYKHLMRVMKLVLYLLCSMDTDEGYHPENFLDLLDNLQTNTIKHCFC